MFYIYNNDGFGQTFLHFKVYFRQPIMNHIISLINVIRTRRFSVALLEPGGGKVINPWNIWGIARRLVCPLVLIKLIQLLPQTETRSLFLFACIFLKKILHFSAFLFYWNNHASVSRFFPSHSLLNPRSKVVWSDLICIQIPKETEQNLNDKEEIKK